MEDIKLIESNTGSYVELSSHELMFLAQSGQPYRGQLFIQYNTDGYVIDLLSLKNMIESLRHETITLENISQVIHQHIDKTIENSSLCVTVMTTARGGISSTIKYGSDEHQEPQSKPIVFGM